MTDCYRRFLARFMFFTILVVGIFLMPDACGADDNRAQYPAWLANSYIGINIGRIDYQFSEDQLMPGYRADSISIPRSAVQLAFGHNFNDHLSAQMTYVRPVKWVRYEGVNGIDGVYSSHSVSVNAIGLTIRGTVPVRGPLSLYAEGGLGVITRSGFKIDGQYIMRDANYTTVLLGGGLKYQLNSTWDLQASMIYSPSEKRFQQPKASMISGGVVFNMRPIPMEQVKVNGQSGNIFPRNIIQIGYTTNTFGTGANRFVSGKVPIFWGGDANVRRGAMLLYQRNIFHTKKIFSFDLGLSSARFRDVKEGAVFSTVSVFPQFKFIPIRSGLGDLYLTYSLAGPTYVSRIWIDGIDTGTNFTFQDLMGLGCYVGRQKNINMEVRIGHYSSGNIFPNNPGIQIPLTFNVGYAF